jgi:hypothetical protein
MFNRQIWITNLNILGTQISESYTLNNSNYFDYFELKIRKQIFQVN